MSETCRTCHGEKIYQPDGQEEIYKCPDCQGVGKMRKTVAYALDKISFVLSEQIGKPGGIAEYIKNRIKSSAGAELIDLYAKVDKLQDAIRVVSQFKKDGERLGAEIAVSIEVIDQAKTAEFLQEVVAAGLISVITGPRE